MWYKFLRFWIKGSAVAVIFVTVELILGIQINPLVNTGSNFFDWVLSYLILLTPLGAVAGYFFLWILSFLLQLIGLGKLNITSLEPKQNKTTCPYAGVIIQDKDDIPPEVPKPQMGEIFKIEKDWRVMRPNKHTYGWIDVEGMIHIGKPSLFTGIQPKAVLAGGDTGIKIKGDSVWYKDILFGKLINK